MKTDGCGGRAAFGREAEKGFLRGDNNCELKISQVQSFAANLPVRAEPELHHLFYLAGALLLVTFVSSTSVITP